MKSSISSVSRANISIVKKRFGKFILIILFSLIPTILVWLPFFAKLKSFWTIPIPQNGMATIVANYDGPLYLVAAKTLYNKTMIEMNFQFPLPSEYYTAHFPLYPLLIKIVGYVMNYPYAMLLVTLASSILATYFFEKLISQFTDKKNALFLTFVFSIFPARWLIVRSVGSADPLFIAGILASVYFFKNKKFWLAGIWGMVSVLTKSPGILLFASYAIYYVIESFKNKKIDFKLKKTYPLLLIPIGLILVFIFYKITFGDFFAYFHSGDNIHLRFPPFQIFNFSAPWVGTFWLEEIIFIYIIGAIGIYKLVQKKELELASFTGLFYLTILFVAHRDLLRYFLPVVPFLIVAFSDVLTSKEFKIALGISIIPIYLYSLAFISQNVMPIANWTPFL
jgi:hypothetical protein